MSSTVKLVLSYDGSPFYGWAKQPGQPTVEQALEDVITTISGGERPRLIVAGRTDRGVHALGQVVSYGATQAPLLRSLNALLPNEVAVHSSELLKERFNARTDATSRAYRYRILNSRTPHPLERGRSLWWRSPLSYDLLQSCAEALLGEHDFTAFTPTQTYHVRFKRKVTAAGWRIDNGILTFEIEADAFMRTMNRILVGTMLEVASGKRTLSGFKQLLEGSLRKEAGVTAPPHGLYLIGAGYGAAVLKH